MSDEETTKPGAQEKHATPSETTRTFTESCPDGFASDVPDWVAYCPECGAKLPLKDHVECAHYRGPGKVESGEVTTIECAYAQKAQIRPRTKTQE